MCSPTSSEDNPALGIPAWRPPASSLLVAIVAAAATAVAWLGRSRVADALTWRYARRPSGRGARALYGVRRAPVRQPGDGAALACIARLGPVHRDRPGGGLLVEAALRRCASATVVDHGVDMLKLTAARVGSTAAAGRPRRSASIRDALVRGMAPLPPVYITPLREAPRLRKVFRAFPLHKVSSTAAISPGGQLVPAPHPQRHRLGTVTSPPARTSTCSASCPRRASRSAAVRNVVDAPSRLSW